VHVLALIEELDMGNSLGLDTVDAWSDKIPWITDVLPGGRYSVGDFDEAGGVQAVMSKLRKHLNLNCNTVNGKTVAENLEKARVIRPEIIKDITKPLYEHGMMVLRGNLATSAIVRPSVIPSKMLNIAGPARVFESEADALEALKNKTIQPGNVIVVKYEGPRGAPGLREMLELTCYLGVSGLDQSVAILTDGKFSGFAKGPFICQVTPEAAMGGPFAVVEEGDIIEINIPAKRLNLKVSDEEIKKRIDRWQPREAKVKSGFLTLYARLAEPCSKGAGLQLKL
jgi:dihydroxy-acid dehydratase